MVLLKNCKIVSENSINEADILIEDRIIQKIGKNIEYSGEKIDLTGKYVFPGIIDSHVHFRWGNSEKEDFVSGSEAAIFGGVVFAIDMPNNNPPVTTKEIFYKKMNEGNEKSKVNLYFSYGVTENNYLETISDAKFYKIFTVKSVGDLFISDYSKLREILDQNKIFAVHAEHKDVILKNSETYNLDSFENHCKIRSRESEIEAVREILDALKEVDKNSRNTPHVHFCHISVKEALELIKNAKKMFKNVKISVEVSPHHLFLNSEMAGNLKGSGKFNPPLRTKEDNLALLNGIIEGTVDIVSTDHAPHKDCEKLNPVENCPSGISGIETLVPLIMNLVHDKKISIFDVYRVLSKNPSEIFKINNKIEIGNFANMSIIDLDKKMTISGKNFKSKSKITPFENWEVMGVPVYTIVNGNIIQTNI
ncbi:dihydroorotase, multifunctional complex type [Methanococcus vannielii SB]|uniref:Dihydroorotase n=1 Tax=Methanococcus vannielii (strain ATCC 35089 / DSM 1224 / JCM 13029 / OCM 148 / SB) TaxID=406327 RepID=A6UP23_METVS|nr:dihydroorotase [Methanococcus vannielii]ABR54245.1 dihydroorotase, multifunctional complex type [Methanococcus vannielii SB]